MENEEITQENLQEDIEKNPQQDSSITECQNPVSENIESAVINETVQYADTSAMQMENHIKKAAAKDINSIKNLVQTGIIDPQHGQYLCGFVIQHAFDAISTKQGLISNPNETPNQSKSKVDLNNQEFFKQEGRSSVLDYLKKTNTDFDKDEISHITQLVENIENSAIAKHLRKQDYEKTLNSENEAAKRRLSANAQKSSAGEITGQVYTREQIGKMSGAEFAKNEKAIMEQLRKGMIR